MKLDEIVTKYYENLNSNDKIVWQYIYQNKKKCSKLSIEELAKLCWVSRSTIMRFAQKIGLSGYSELKTYLKWETENIQERCEDLVKTICNQNIEAINYYQTLNYDGICQELDAASRIYLYGTGVTQDSVCKEFKRMLLSVGILPELISGEGEFKKSIPLVKKNDIVFIVSKSGESDFIKEITFELKNRNIKFISLTGYGNSTLARMSTYNLFVNTDKLTINNTSTFTSMTFFFLILEILFAKFTEYKIKQKQLK